MTAKFCLACGTPVGQGDAATVRSADAEVDRPGERRQLTVLFCDLVGSTLLSQRLDAEEWRDLVEAYHRTAAAAVTRFGGHVAQYLGDGLLVYFGWPTAREDDPERAIRAGFAILDAMVPLNATLAAGTRLAVRIGMHTGSVVIGDDGAVFGDTANVAARVQGAAEPDTVVVSAATQRLAAGLFVVEDWGPQQLKGVREPLTLYRVVQPSGVRSRLDVAAGRLTRFVGREVELATLVDRWERAQDGEGQNVVILGEAGVGKSRLVYQLHEHLAAVPHTWLECGATPYTQGTPFHPLIALVSQGLAFGSEDTADEKLAKLEVGLRALASTDNIAVLADFLGLPPPTRLQLSPELQRRKTIDLLAQWNLALSEVQPLVLVVEDLHWCDVSTLELLGHLIAQSPTARVLLLAAARPEFTPPWPARSNLATVQLARLTRRQARDMVAAVSVEQLPEDVLEALVGRADGIPLHVEELTRAVMDPRAGRSVEAIPATLQDSLMARLDALGSPVKALTQLASALGREFDYGLLHAVSSLKEAELHAALAAAVRAEIFYQRGTPPDATYVFKHALIRDAAYESMLRSTRRRYHGRIAEILIERMPHVVEAQPELLGHHHAEAGHIRPAIDQWHEAGRRSLRRSACMEAILHLKRALVLLAGQPRSRERDREELDLQIELGSALMAAQGWGSVEGARCYAGARELCLRVGDERELFPILWGFWMIHVQRSELTEQRESAGELVAIAERLRDPAMLVQAHHASWGNPFLGDFAAQLEHVERGLAHYDPAEHSQLAPQYGGHDAGVCGHCHRGVLLWATGYPERSGESFAAALALADQIAHPLSKAHPLAMTSWLPVFRSDWPEAFRSADAAMKLLSEVGMPTWIRMAAVTRGWALVALGEIADGLAQIRRALEFGDLVGVATMHAFYAEALHLAGAADEALAVLDDALPLMDRKREGLWKANAMALKGDLLLAGGRADAEVWYQRGIAVARAQSAKMWELRAATRLARYWHLQGKTVEARTLLAPLYAWFTEGFATRDLIEAKLLLDELA